MCMHECGWIQCICPSVFSECGQSASLQLEVSGGWIAECQLGLFNASECNCA